MFITGAYMIDIDGFYKVHSQRDEEGAFAPKGDGVTEIRNGLTFRKDTNGCIWESTFEVLNDHEVKLETTVDPSHAAADYYILDEKGNQTKGIVTYKSMLKLERKGGRTVMSGSVKHGQTTTHLTLTSITAEEAKQAGE